MVMLSHKAALASAVVVVTAAAMLLHAGPPIKRLLAAEVPRAFASIVVWLTPPYLYFVLNAVILCIAASFRFDKPHAESTELASSPTPEMVVHLMEYMPPYEEELVENASSTRFVTATTEDDRGDQEAIVLGEKETVSKAETVGEEQEVGPEFVTSSSNFSPEQRPSTESPMEYLAGLEKPLVSIRFGHRKSLKPGPDGKALRRVARPRREETLESTWRTITEGRAMPLARHLKKSDTLDTRVVREDAAESDAAAAIRKSETFSDRATARPLAGGGVGESSSSLTSKTSGVGRGRLRREPSLGQEELNRRVEAFIKKFNEDMRLQRQQSLQQFMEMINRGSH
ncbi:uncharacterized protein LOC135622365 [Musa acuminata AAA Group]|uniref:uncharacterized protein LOC103997240 n=1 Tax=Musa acuminata AAA Group TaxID=214697 RepID=UPI0031D8ADD4